MVKRSSAKIPPGLRARLETARLDLLTLFRALDRMDLSPEEIPQGHLRQLFQLDADFAEALWGLDQPPSRLNTTAMLRDTLASLTRMPALIAQFRQGLPPRVQPNNRKSRSRDPKHARSHRSLQSSTRPRYEFLSHFVRRSLQQCSPSLPPQKRLSTQAQRPHLQ